MGKSRDMFMEQREYEQHLDEVSPAKQNTETGLSLELNNLININKDDIRQKVDAVVTTIQEGWTDPLDALIFAKKGVELFSALEKNVRGYAEGKSYGKDYIKYGTTVTESQVSNKADYSVCEDPIWDGIVADIKVLDAEKKEREKFLSGITKPTEIIINECEVYTIKPLIKTGRMGLKLSVK